jgi:hypothetical protein
LSDNIYLSDLIERYNRNRESYLSGQYGLLPKYGIRRNTVSLAASLRFLPTTGSNFTQFRKLVPKYRDSDMRTALRGCSFSPSGYPKMLEGATREKFFLLIFRYYLLYAFGQQAEYNETQLGRSGRSFLRGTAKRNLNKKITCIIHLC